MEMRNEKGLFIKDVFEGEGQIVCSLYGISEDKGRGVRPLHKNVARRPL
jgi:hypothetical protein